MTGVQTCALPISLRIPQIVLDGSRFPTVGDYWVGDTINVSVPEHSFFDNLGTFRIDRISVAIDKDDKESVQLVLNNI